MIGRPPSITVGAAAPLFYRFRSGIGEHVLVVPYSRVFDVASDANDFTWLDLEASQLAEPVFDEASLDAIAEPAPQSISLNVSSSCNLTCGYCYAARGNFGGAQPTPMEWATARAAIDRLIADADSVAPITIGFLGGEPFVNRRLIHRAVAYAASEGMRHRLDIRFSVTTNGTLLEPGDIVLLREHPFAVTISLDGAADVQDRQRPRHGGRGSWEAVVDRVAPLLAAPGKAKIAARSTVTRDNLDIATALETLAALGFPEVGFAPLRVGPENSGTLRDADWPDYLAALIAASRQELDRLRRGRAIRLTNLAIALKQLHRGAASPYPCGAGGGYFSVSATGGWYACHRAIGQEAYALGSNTGLDAARRRKFVLSHHVHAQPELLGTLPLLWRLPPRGEHALGGVLRFYPRLAVILSRSLLRAGRAAARGPFEPSHRCRRGPAMITPSAPKLLPRNVSALRRGRDPASATRISNGNPVSTRLESGIGNFFPGLECDMRNLERRFFPFLEVDTDFSDIVVAAVDLAGATEAVSNGVISVADLENYRTIQLDVAQGIRWSVRTIAGDFGPLGAQTVTLSELSGQSFGEGRTPADAWVAIRLLKERSLVTLILGRTPGPGQITLTGPRTRYLDDDGALSRLFEPGELTQSLCSPWTHDFRDCACFYWASNHPDIALPPLPDASTPADAPQWNLDTAWERSDRSLTAPPVVTISNGSPSVPAGSTAVLEMQHHEINRDWQLLNFVLERRERVTPYQTLAPPKANPYPNTATLLAQLRYAAGVELAVMLEYLAAAWSLRQDVNALPQETRDDIRAAFAEIRRIAIGEMSHIRTVNDLIAGLSPAGAFEPALAVAAEIPLGGPDQFQPLQFRPAVPETIKDFVTIEAPSQSVDGLYAAVFETLIQGAGSEEQIQSVRTLMSEGGDHFQTFLFVQEWLGRHVPATYLVAGGPLSSPEGSRQHQIVQQRFVNVLNMLYDGYKLGIPAGAGAINQARGSMLGQDGIEGALDAVAAAGLLVTFDPVADPRFAPIHHP